MRRQARLATYFGVLASIFLVLQLLLASQLELEDAVYLTKNSIKQFQTQYLCKSRRLECPDENPDKSPAETVLVHPLRHVVGGFDLDLDFPFSNVVNSVFPIDLVVSYNVSNTTRTFTARYASFSPVLNGRLSSKYAIVDGHGCTPLNATTHPHYKDKILIVLRGECTFVKKVANLVGSDLTPRAVVVANNEPYRNLITMYLSTFNEDGSLTVPVLFISNEDYKELKGLETEGIRLSIETASIDNWINLMLLMAVSPPLLIVLFYLLMRSIQLCHRRRINTMNLRLVRKMAVYIYNLNHLVPAPNFYEYLALTGQTGDIPLVMLSSDDLANGQDDTTESETLPPSNSLVVNGTDLYSLHKLHLLFAKRDYYPTLKCSICLDRFVPLRSRVLVLECKHVYHETCLLNWLINFRRTCPLCNELLKLVEHLSLLAAENSSYNTFGADFERGPNATHPWLQSSLAWSQTSRNGSNSRANTSMPLALGILGILEILGMLGTQPGALDALEAPLEQNSNATDRATGHLQGGLQNLTAPSLHSGAVPVDPLQNIPPSGRPTSLVQTDSDSAHSGWTHSAGLSVDSGASFVTSRTRLSDVSDYLTPQQSAESLGGDDTQLSTSSDSTILGNRNT